MTELEEGWCDFTNDLTEIKIMPKNRHFILFDNQYILQKSNPDQSNYDTLVFAVRNIEIVKIPNFIEIIGKYAFNSCQLIQKIDISENTKLRIIDKFAFYGCTSINHIKIPLHLTSIEEGAFFSCDILRSVEIPINSELRTIGKDAFNDTIIESISIPDNLVELKKEWCTDIRHLNRIEVSPNNPIYSSYEDMFIIGKSSLENDNYDVLVLCIRNILNMPKFLILLK